MILCFIKTSMFLILAKVDGDFFIGEGKLKPEFLSWAVRAHLTEGRPPAGLFPLCSYLHMRVCLHERPALFL